MSELRLRLRMHRHAGSFQTWHPRLLLLLSLLLLGVGPARADDVQLPQHVVLNQSFGMVMGDDIMNGMVMGGLKAARLPFGQLGAGQRIDTVVFTSDSTDVNTDYMDFTPVCALPEGKWAFQRNCAGCTDPVIYLPMSDYVALGGVQQKRPAATPWGWASYPAVKAWVFVRTYPSRNQRGNSIADKLQTIAGKRSGELFVMDLDQRFTLDLGTFVHDMIPGVQSTRIREKYGWYSTEFAIAYTSDYLSIIPVTRLGTAGKVIYGSLVSSNLMLSAYQYKKASTDSDRLYALLNIACSLGFGYSALAQAKPLLRGAGVFGKPAAGVERQMFEELLGEEAMQQAPKLAAWVNKATGPTAVNPTHGFQYLQDFLTAELAKYPPDVQAAIKATYSWKRIFSIDSKRITLQSLGADTYGLFDPGTGTAQVQDGLPFAASIAIAIHEIDGHGLTYSPEFAYRYIWRTYQGMTRQQFIDQHLGIWMSWEMEATMMGARSVDELTPILGAAAFLDAAGDNIASKEQNVLRLMSDGNVIRSSEMVKGYLAGDVGYAQLYSDMLGTFFDDTLAAGSPIESIAGQYFIYAPSPAVLPLP